MRELHALVTWWSGACSRELCLSVHQQGYGSTHHARPGRTSWSVTFTAATRVLVSSCGSIFPGRVHTVLRWTDRPSGFFAVYMTFAEDRRVLVISWLVGGRMTWEDAAELGGVSVATVGRWYRVFRRTGAFWPDDALGQKHYDNALFNPDFLVAVTSLIVDSPEAFLGEISETLRQLSELPGWEGLPHSPSTVSRVLRAVGYTHKRIITHYRERCAHRRREFARQIRRVPIKCIVSMDEVHKDGSSSYRRYGWALRGVRDEVLVSDPRKSPRYSVMAAVSIDGVVETMTCAVPPSYTALDYTLFIHQLAPSMGKWNPDIPSEEWEAQHARSVLLIDNAAIHSDEADDLAHQYGILVLRLPPYSPDFAPVEGVFSILKQWLAAESSEDRMGGMVMPNGERMSNHVGLMVEVGLGSLTTEQCASQFWRVYWEWLRQDAAAAGHDGGGDGEGEEEDNQELGEDDLFEEDGADEDFMDEE